MVRLLSRCFELGLSPRGPKASGGALPLPSELCHVRVHFAIQRCLCQLYGSLTDARIEDPATVLGDRRSDSITPGCLELLLAISSRRLLSI